MAEQNTQVPRRATGLRLPRLDGWVIGAGLIALVVLAPMASVFWLALHPTENIWPHLMATVLPRYLANTLILMAGLSVLTAALWLVRA